ncbi:MAG: VanZ family protein [Pseudomonadota bacterium]
MRNEFSRYPFPTKLRVAAGIAVFAAAVGLYVLGEQPIAVGLFKPPWDKVAHVVAFAGIAAATGLASGSRGWRLVAWCLGVALAIGSMDELHQAFLPGREAGLDDLSADAAGGLMGAVAMHGMHRMAWAWSIAQRKSKARLRRRSILSLPSRLDPKA